MLHVGRLVASETDLHGKMAEKHPNLALFEKLDLRDLASAEEVFSEDVVFHYFNPLLPDIQGDYIGTKGIRRFFQKISSVSAGTFRIEPVSITPVGDQLVVTQTRNHLTLHDKQIVTDVVVVWRIIKGRITEVWDIPSVEPV